MNTNKSIRAWVRENVSQYLNEVLFPSAEDGKEPEIRVRERGEGDNGRGKNMGNEQV